VLPLQQGQLRYIQGVSVKAIQIQTGRRKTIQVWIGKGLLLERGKGMGYDLGITLESVAISRLISVQLLPYNSKI
jgi:hypothetical protein